jgi:hypothetical protein
MRNERSRLERRQAVAERIAVPSNDLARSALPTGGASGRLYQFAAIHDVGDLRCVARRLEVLRVNNQAGARHDQIAYEQPPEYPRLLADVELGGRNLPSEARGRAVTTYVLAFRAAAQCARLNAPAGDDEDGVASTGTAIIALAPPAPDATKRRRLASSERGARDSAVDR